MPTTSKITANATPTIVHSVFLGALMSSGETSYGFFSTLRGADASARLTAAGIGSGYTGVTLYFLIPSRFSILSLGNIYAPGFFAISIASALGKTQSQKRHSHSSSLSFNIISEPQFLHIPCFEAIFDPSFIKNQKARKSICPQLRQANYKRS